MLQAAYFLPEQSLGGSQTELCILSREISEIIWTGSRHIDNLVRDQRVLLMHTFWRNQLAEHFIKYGRYEPFHIGEYYFTRTHRTRIQFLEGELGYRYLQFRVHTGYVMPETVETKFFAFVEEASKTFDFKKVVGIWNRHNPFQHAVDQVFSPIQIFRESGDVVCAVGGFEFPRLYKDVWNKMQLLADKHSTWTEAEKHDFCLIAQEFVYDVKHRPLVGEESLIGKKFKDFDALIWSKSTPHINSLCGRLNRVFDRDLKQLAMIDSLVAEVGEAKACPIMAQTQTDYSLTSNILVSKLLRAKGRKSD